MIQQYSLNVQTELHERFETHSSLLSGNDLALPVLQIHHGAEAIMLQLEDVIGIIEGSLIIRSRIGRIGGSTTPF